MLRGIYKHGYANYMAIKSDKKNWFLNLDQNKFNKDFPSDDSITRRLKKIIQIIIKNWNNNTELMNLNDNFSKSNIKELNNEEKKHIFDFVTDFGIPRKVNGEENYLLIYEKLKEKKVFNEIIERDELNELIQGIKNFIINVRKKLKQFIEG